MLINNVLWLGLLWYTGTQMLFKVNICPTDYMHSPKKKSNKCLQTWKRLFSRSDLTTKASISTPQNYNGTVNIYNHETGAIVKTFEVAQVPTCCVKFIARKNWFVAGSDDF